MFAIEAPRLRPLPAWIPEVYALHQRIVDLEGYVHVDGHMYSVPYKLIGKTVEVRETKDRVRVFIGPREVATHALRAATGGRQRTTLPEHRPPRGQVAAALRSPEEDELAAAGAPFAEFAAMLRKRSLRWPIALRRLAQLRRDYPAGPLIAAIETAIHYGLYDIDRIERVILKNIAATYFQLPGDHDEG
ncbi:hypothetical protein BH11MYX1_BH11MYX1_31290 [soil metagenome]